MVATPSSPRTVGTDRDRPADVVARALLLFAAALAVLLLVPPFLRSDFAWVHGFTWQEATDLLTPLATLPLALALDRTGTLGARSRIVLIALVAMWTAGQAIHLAANAIGDAVPSGPERDAFYLTAPGALDRFLDEVLSHWLWHVAWVGLLALLLWAGTGGPATEPRPVRAAVVLSAVAGLLHGFTWFVVTDEGDTWPLALATAIVLLLAAWWRRRRDPDQVITTFLAVGSLVTLVVYALWIALFGWMPVPICHVLPC